MNIKGIILAGGHGVRLFPHTLSINKHLLPIYDKPMIFYSLSVLMLAKIKNILLITKEKDIEKYEHLLGDGSRLGIKINYEVQNEPRGICEAFLIGKKFIGNSSVCLILGDNILYGDGLIQSLEEAKKIVTKKKKAVIFGYKVNNPKEFGVIEFGGDRLKKIVEKPKKPFSNLASVGLYFYPNSVKKISNSIKPSKRNELEITDLNNIYLKEKKIDIVKLDRGTAWLDTGSFEGLLNASNFVRTLEVRQGIDIAPLDVKK